jgi:hypothetical protein
LRGLKLFIQGIETFFGRFIKAWSSQSPMAYACEGVVEKSKPVIISICPNHSFQVMNSDVGVPAYCHGNSVKVDSKVTFCAYSFDKVPPKDQPL